MGEVSRVVADISGSAREQATALGQVNRAVNDMDRLMQQNAAMVEETMAASHGPREEVAALVRTVGGFRLAEASPVVDHHASVKEL